MLKKLIAAITVKIWDWDGFLKNLLSRTMIGNNNKMINVQIIINEAAKSKPSVANHVLDAMLYAGVREIENQYDVPAKKNLKERIAKRIKKQGAAHVKDFDEYIQANV